MPGKVRQGALDQGVPRQHRVQGRRHRQEARYCRAEGGCRIRGYRAQGKARGSRRGRRYVYCRRAQDGPEKDDGLQASRRPLAFKFVSLGVRFAVDGYLPHIFTSNVLVPGLRCIHESKR